VTGAPGAAAARGLRFGYLAASMRARLPLLLLLFALACSHVAGEVNYGKSAEEDYRKGEKALETHSHLEATKYFEHVRNKYPFSKYAAAAELRLADVKYDQERWVEAAEAYQSFARLHPSHDQVDYAAFRAGLAHWKDGPTDMVLFPAAYERDLVQVRDAAKTLDEFLKKYPESKYAPEATKLLAEARKRLVDHEWYAAEFYAKRKHWPAVAVRLETIVKNYPGHASEPAALLQLAEAYVKMDERYRAQQALQQLIVKHPQDPRRAEAEKMLASLR
jgi:outer membrane protein assembly factor BamD